MSSVSIAEAKDHFVELLDRVVEGEEIVITRHNHPIARLVPENLPVPSSVRSAVEQLREVSQSIRARGPEVCELSDAEVASAIAEGRN